MVPVSSFLSSSMISNLMENNFSVLCPEYMGNCLSQFFGSVKIHGNPLIWSHFFFPGAVFHKPLMWNALWKQFKMAGNRQIIIDGC